ncbi:hypothetical protein FNV43_RR06335 [Rhamnella rubrinervis]|uniref:PPM-type phosphatase domain-containing protein n=1 Tax=Rhamnella rubrinervis TaxID=2594499 RepID=A0A8K0HEC4_9ROSA|nr:hypothetical protein FNV43_RR06335 [Rhamnella rubrinervis]
MKERKPILETDDVDQFIKVKDTQKNDVDFIKVKKLEYQLSGVDEEDDKEEIASRHVTHGFHLVKGKRDHGMEDYIVAENTEVNGYKLGLHAIFGGHSGRDVAEYLHSHLFDNILKEKELVESRGRFLSQLPGNVSRVDGTLVMTRGIRGCESEGTNNIKTYVRIENINMNSEFIILASDGLWKLGSIYQCLCVLRMLVMSNQEASDYIKNLDDARRSIEEVD